MCGEHGMFQTFPNTTPGSSPRVRGTRNCLSWCRLSLGIIPACAGNTNVSETSPLPNKDHPRVCGEHRRYICMESILPGSSPRVRGTRPIPKATRTRQGIIPACAGNTALPSRWPSRKRDHPRVCGEHYQALSTATGRPGSSPRVRGTRRHDLPVPDGRGIIPACAGNTRGLRRSSEHIRDHPRVCGEHDMAVIW
ncbi:hypothetical protein BIFANG_03351 [Bifidobacterium angulatum DSM 20098 = JCM 7096]|nr:hypothetical protein BIFANG_03351 [Bifidobacterium angulatum DSM 20098 = JCM 7096]